VSEADGRVIAFNAIEQAWTDPSGALLIGPKFQTADSRQPEVIYAPGTWDRAERIRPPHERAEATR
jgi:hypothetical protein